MGTWWWDGFLGFEGEAVRGFPAALDEGQYLQLVGEAGIFV